MEYVRHLTDGMNVEDMAAPQQAILLNSKCVTVRFYDHTPASTLNNCGVFNEGGLSTEDSCSQLPGHRFSCSPCGFEHRDHRMIQSLEYEKDFVTVREIGNLLSATKAWSFSTLLGYP